MRMLLILAGFAETLTGLALLIDPALTAHLLLGAELAGIAIPIARVTGIALLSLGLGCTLNSLWLAMWTYTTLVTLFLAWLGIATPFSGILLWPAVAAHALLAVLLARARFARTAPTTPSPVPAAGVQ